jgi:hypothetical protein
MVPGFLPIIQFVRTTLRAKGERLSCYLRHLDDLLKEGNIPLGKEDRKKVDQAIHRMLGMESKHCPEVWRAVRAEIERDREGFVRRLKEELG